MSDNASESLAAVDLGSNSFHLIVAQVMDGRIQVVDRMKEMVRLAAGLDEGNWLSGPVMEHAVDTLKRFGERLRDVPAHKVRAVGTNTLRKAKNRGEFLARARPALGHSIDIIAGREEARLIYLGVSHSIEGDGERRLVVDIGGGSTELILGRQFRPERMDSLHIGCVEMSRRFFGAGSIDALRMRAAEIAALQELEPMSAEYRRIGWDSPIGASGTILAVQQIVEQQGWCQDGITLAALRRLRKALIGATHIQDLELDGLQAERAPVFPGGVAILGAIFEALGIEHMRASSGALREGLLYDLLGRIHHEDVRETTVEGLTRRYHIDAAQTGRVAGAALALLDQAPSAWGVGGTEHAQWLCWAARLHEIGLSISHSHYQKHGAYLITNLDMPGFSQGEQALLAVLIRGHRRKLSLADFEGLPETLRRQALYLCILLRIAVLLHRSRSETELPAIALEGDEASIKLRFSPEWLLEHPLTEADLGVEAEYLRAANVKLRFK